MGCFFCVQNLPKTEKYVNIPIVPFHSFSFSSVSKNLIETKSNPWKVTDFFVL